jgi:hypothetical protein
MFGRPHLNRKNWAWWHTPVIPATSRKPQIGLWSRPARQRAYLKITRVKRAKDVVKIVVLRKHKALSSNPSTAKEIT